MKGRQLFEKIDGINEKYLMEADSKVGKNIKSKKIVLLVAVFCLMGSVISVAAINSRRYNNRSSISVSSSQIMDMDYETLQGQIEKLDFTPMIPEKFSNGMLFNEAQIMTTEDIGDNEVLAQFPMVMVSYCLENKQVILGCEPWEEKYMALQSDTNIIQYNGYQLNIYFIKILMVPQNMDDNELKNILANKQNKGYTLIRSDKVSEPIIKYENKVLWLKDGILYTITNSADSGENLMTENEIVKMAQEMIDEAL